MILKKYTRNDNKALSGRWRRGSAGSRGYDISNAFNGLAASKFVVEFEYKINSEYVTGTPTPQLINITFINSPNTDIGINIFQNGATLFMQYPKTSTTRSSTGIAATIGNIHKVILSFDTSLPLAKYFFNGAKTEATDVMYQFAYPILLQLSGFKDNNSGELNGWMKNVRIYKGIALSDADGAYLYNEGLYIPTELLTSTFKDALVSEYKCNQNAGSILKDNYGNNNLLPSSPLVIDYRARVASGEKFTAF